MEFKKNKIGLSTHISIYNFKKIEQLLLNRKIVIDRTWTYKQIASIISILEKYSSDDFFLAGGIILELPHSTSNFCLQRTVTSNQVNVKFIADLSFRQQSISHLPNLAHIEQKCLFVSRNELEIELKFLSAEKFLNSLKCFSSYIVHNLTGVLDMVTVSIFSSL